MLSRLKVRYKQYVTNKYMLMLIGVLLGIATFQFIKLESGSVETLLLITLVIIYQFTLRGKQNCSLTFILTKPS